MVSWAGGTARAAPFRQSRSAFLPTSDTCWLIRSGACQWTVAGAKAGGLLIQETTSFPDDPMRGGRARTGTIANPDETWMSAIITIGQVRYTLGPDPMDGVRVCNADGEPILRSSPPWKDSHLKSGVAQITTLLSAASKCPDLPMLAGFAFCPSYVAQPPSIGFVALDLLWIVPMILLGD
jgi:hypothetical protein